MMLTIKVWNFVRIYNCAIRYVWRQRYLYLDKNGRQLGGNSTNYSILTILVVDFGRATTKSWIMEVKILFYRTEYSNNDETLKILTCPRRLPIPIKTNEIGQHPTNKLSKLPKIQALEIQTCTMLLWKYEQALDLCDFATWPTSKESPSSSAGIGIPVLISCKVWTLF